MDDVYDMPGHLIRRMQQISTALFTEECEAFDLTSVQYAALRALQAHPGIDATRLSSLIAFDRSTLGDVLERLEAKGWIERGPSPLDRRVKLLSLSTEGHRILQEVEPAVARVQQRLLEPLAPSHRRTMIRLMKQLTALHNDVSPQPRSLTAAKDPNITV